MTPDHVRALAFVLKVTLRTGALPGVKRAPGAGRKKGGRNARGRISKADEVKRLRAEKPELTYEEIGRELGISKQAVSKHLRK